MRSAVRIDVVTIFPGYLAPLREALPGRAIEAGLVDLAVHDLRRWTHDVHQAVDDAPYGGGPGMVMRPQVWGEALDAVLADGPRAGWSCPRPPGGRSPRPPRRSGPPSERLVFACGRYEGIDERVMEHFAPVEEVSIGDYVLVGGEVAVLVMVEAMVRLLPGVLGNPQSAAEDSFSDGLLEGPAYTRPESWRGLAVPEVLRSGNHAAIARGGATARCERTAARRPDSSPPCRATPSTPPTGRSWRGSPTRTVTGRRRCRWLGAADDAAAASGIMDELAPARAPTFRAAAPCTSIPRTDLRDEHPGRTGRADVALRHPRLPAG